MKKVAVVASKIVLCASLAALAPCSAFAQGDTGVAVVEEEVAAAVAVDAVDMQNRTITVKNKSGEMQTVVVPESVKNLAQVKKGDNIVMRYRQAIATRILKPGEQSGGVVESKESSKTAPLGAKPGALSESETKATIKVKAVDTAKNTLTFEGPQGATRTVAIKSPDMQAQLRQLKPGDNVEVVYKEALALDVETPK